MNHGNRLDDSIARREQFRHEAVVGLLQQDGPMGDIFRSFLANLGPPPEGVMDIDELMEQVQRICDDVTDMYKTTPATASECFHVLQDRLLEVDMEPDCVGEWQEFLVLMQEEEEWDSLSPLEQYRAKYVPKGKQRKPTHKYNLRRRSIE